MSPFLYCIHSITHYRATVKNKVSMCSILPRLLHSRGQSALVVYSQIEKSIDKCRPRALAHVIGNSSVEFRTERLDTRQNHTSPVPATGNTFVEELVERHIDRVCLLESLDKVSAPL